MSGGKPGFTPTQGQYLAFIDAYTRINLRPPAEADIQRRFGVSLRPSTEGSGPRTRAPYSTPTRRARSIEVLVRSGVPVLEMPDQPVKTSVHRY